MRDWPGGQWPCPLVRTGAGTIPQVACAEAR